MSLHPDILDALVASGASAEMIAAAVKAAMAVEASALSEKRAKVAERQRRHRSVSRHVTPCHTESQEVTPCHEEASPPVSPPSFPLTNPLITPPISPPSKQTRAKPAKNGAFLPDDWMPDPEDQQFAVTLLGNPDAANWEWQKFRDYWRGKPGAAGRKSDWGMTWRNWIRRASENQRGRGPPGKNQLGGHELAAELRRQIDEATSAEFGSVEGSCEVGYDFGFDPGRR